MAVEGTTTRSTILDTAQRIMARKGFAAVGINEVLTEADVPKGSFYHYFESKDAFGQAMMKQYFVEYLADMDRIITTTGASPAERLMTYFEQWRQTQSFEDCQGKCLAVKLGAEVADLSESMRLALKEGTSAIVDRLERLILAGSEDGSVVARLDARETAEALYDLWLGASVMSKIRRDREPLDTAVAATQSILGI